MSIAGVHLPVMKSDEWLTPRNILEDLGPFDLDPCAPVNPPWGMAAKHYTQFDNGLNKDWNGFVWMNPPYGRETGVWLDKLATHGTGIALVYARTETKMFFDHVWPRANGVLFIKGRLHFHHISGQRAKANSGGPSVLIGYGMEAQRRLEASNIKGKLLCF